MRTGNWNLEFGEIVFPAARNFFHGISFFRLRQVSRRSPNKLFFLHLLPLKKNTKLQSKMSVPSQYAQMFAAYGGGAMPAAPGSPRGRKPKGTVLDALIAREMGVLDREQGIGAHPRAAGSPRARKPTAKALAMQMQQMQQPDSYDFSGPGSPRGMSGMPMHPMMMQMMHPGMHFAQAAQAGSCGKGKKEKTKYVICDANGCRTAKINEAINQKPSEAARKGATAGMTTMMIYSEADGKWHKYLGKRIKLKPSEMNDHQKKWGMKFESQIERCKEPLDPRWKFLMPSKEIGEAPVLRKEFSGY